MSESCVYNVPNFISALIVSVATQQTIGELPPSETIYMHLALCMFASRLQYLARIATVEYLD